jgi:hypothetical protein
VNTRLLRHIGYLSDRFHELIPFQSKKHFHLAIAFHKNKFLEVAYNEYTHSSSLQRRYANKVGKPQNKYNHAEIGLLNACKGIDFDTIVVLRMSKTGNLLPSKPCEICRAAIADTSIKKLIYSGKNTLIEERIK